MDTDNLLQLVEDHLQRTGMSARDFGNDFMGDPNFVYQLREGRECRSATVRKVLDRMESGLPPKGAA